MHFDNILILSKRKIYTLYVFSELSRIKKNLFEKKEIIFFK